MYNMLFLVIVNGVIVKVYLCGWLLNILFKSSPSKSILPAPPSIPCKLNRRKKLQRKFHTLFFLFCLFVCFLFFRVCTHACNLWWGVFSEAPWLRKFGNLSIRENLLWRQHTTERWPYRLWGRGESGVSPSGEEYEMAEVKCLHFKHTARFGGKSYGQPDV